MANREKSVDGIFFLQLAVSLFLIVSGLLGLMDYTSTGSKVFRALGIGNDVVAIIITVLELVSGTILLVGLFLLIRNRTLFFAVLFVFVLWALRVVLYYFLNDFLQPDALVWLHNMAPDLIVLSSLWVILRRYA
ncbi:hypothetical protein [Marispirochaeta aestuarii]|uniref:DoxX family protein n=1 Tax=Marispirochaeta aestuarii TaxID=1963862 RepID=A0A1Y1RV16_9SPIO|nr:hypothetical protein [Marispirochaeta aestuarii]ORC32981.1 hypothetical protein B4O97_15135 [Marispirochaeta aestuarii]